MHKFLHALLISVFLSLLCKASAAADAESNRSGSDTDALQLWQIQKVLASKKYVDLTHEFAPGIPRWPGFPDETRKTIYWYDKRQDTMGSGFFSELFTHVGQWGTHVDPPAHFIKGLRTVDQIDPKEMVLPLVVIDVHDEAGKPQVLVADAHRDLRPLAGRRHRPCIDEAPAQAEVADPADRPAGRAVP